MKKLKLFTLTLLSVVLVTTTFSQTKIEKTKQLKLKALYFEYSNGYFDGYILQGYKYPSIRKGFYHINVFVTYDDLKLFYKELINVSKSEDGEYKLTKKYGDVYEIKKSGSRIYLYGLDDDGNMGVIKIKIKWLESDLEMINNEYSNL